MINYSFQFMFSLFVNLFFSCLNLLVYFHVAQHRILSQLITKSLIGFGKTIFLTDNMIERKVYQLYKKTS